MVNSAYSEQLLVTITPADLKFQEGSVCVIIAIALIKIIQ